MKNILSLFDGMSCCQIALNRAGIKYDKYFASEIDKYAIKVTQANFPDTVQLGSVTNVKASDLPEIYLMAGGSPCQSFSFAGKRKGMTTKCEQEILSLDQYLKMKEDGFEFEGQSYLFWEFVRLLKEVKPKYFLLENVMMEEKWERIITRTLGVHPIIINAALVSAQSRKRLWWTNIGLVQSGLFGDMICGIQQPKDRGILLRDILESEVDEKYYLSDAVISRIERKNYSDPKINPDKGGPINTKNNSGQMSVDNGTTLIKIDKLSNPKPNQDKASTFTAVGHSGGNHSDMDLIIVASRGRGEIQNTQQQLEPRTDGKTNTITSVQKDNLLAIMLGRSQEWGVPESDKGKAYTLCKNQPHGIKEYNRIRRLTPTECERLQTVADGYTNHVSDSQRYKMLGNGWCVDVPAHIFTYLPK